MTTVINLSVTTPYTPAHKDTTALMLQPGLHNTLAFLDRTAQEQAWSLQMNVHLVIPANIVMIQQKQLSLGIVMLVSGVSWKPLYLLPWTIQQANPVQRADTAPRVSQLQNYVLWVHGLTAQDYVPLENVYLALEAITVMVQGLWSHQDHVMHAITVSIMPPHPHQRMVGLLVTLAPLPTTAPREQLIQYPVRMDLIWM